MKIIIHLLIMMGNKNKKENKACQEEEKVLKNWIMNKKEIFN